MKDLSNALKKRGWNSDEIECTLRAVHRGENEKSVFSSVLEKVVFWIALFVCVLGNFFISVALIPILLLIKGSYFLVMLSVVGMTAGILFELVVCVLENIERKHYIISGIFVPFLALINIFLVSSLSNNFSSLMHVSAGVHNPFVVSIVYVVSFLVPYVVHKFMIYSKPT